MDNLAETKDKMFLCIPPLILSSGMCMGRVLSVNTLLFRPHPFLLSSKHASPCAQSLQPIIDTHLSSEISQVGTIKTSTTHIQHFEWTWTTFYSLQIYFIRVIMKNQQVYKLTPLRLWAVHRCGREPSLSDILYASGFVVHFYHLTPAHPPLAPSFGQWTKLISNSQRWEDGARSILYCVCVIFTN